MWALFYWNHIARRQTNPMILHGKAETDPIRQFNDYGFTMCSTISGINCMIWQHMGYKVKYYDIAVHTVPEVFYDDRGTTTTTACPSSTRCATARRSRASKTSARRSAVRHPAGRRSRAHRDLPRAQRHRARTGSSKAPTRSATCATSAKTRSSPVPEVPLLPQRRRARPPLHPQPPRRRDLRAPLHAPRQAEGDAKGDKFASDPAYFTPNGKTKEGKPLDPEAANPRYRIRGNGVRTYAAAAKPGNDGIYKVEGANVITSLKITRRLRRLDRDQHEQRHDVDGVPSRLAGATRSTSS